MQTTKHEYRIRNMKKGTTSVQANKQSSPEVGTIARADRVKEVKAARLWRFDETDSTVL